jgi:hypothetical protein
VWGTAFVHKGFFLINLKEREYLEDIDIDRRIIVKVYHKTVRENGGFL